MEQATAVACLQVGSGCTQRISRYVARCHITSIPQRHVAPRRLHTSTYPPLHLPLPPLHLPLPPPQLPLPPPSNSCRGRGAAPARCGCGGPSSDQPTPHRLSSPFGDGIRVGDAQPLCGRERLGPHQERERFGRVRANMVRWGFETSLLDSKVAKPIILR